MLKAASCTLTAAEEELTKLESPLYSARRECEPAVKVIVSAAIPDEFTGEVPSEVPPSVNKTVPVGTPPEEVRVAVKLAGCEGTTGLGCTVSTTEGTALLTT